MGAGVSTVYRRPWRELSPAHLCLRPPVLQAGNSYYAAALKTLTENSFRSPCDELEPSNIIQY